MLSNSMAIKKGLAGIQVRRPGCALTPIPNVGAVCYSNKGKKAPDHGAKWVSGSRCQWPTARLTMTASAMVRL
jgi:hypothetical protein